MLSPTLMYRKSIILVLAMLCISLTTLGIRLPWTTGISSGKAKPRPRAIVQNQINKCNEIVLKNISIEPALLENIFTHIHIETTQSIPLIRSPKNHTFHVLFANASRASPICGPTKT